MPVALADKIRGISCPVTRAAELSAHARTKYTLAPDLARLRKLALAECRWLLNMSATAIYEKTGTPRSQVFTLTKGLRPAVASDTSTEQPEQSSDRRPDTVHISRMILVRPWWNTIAYLGRADSPVACNVLLGVITDLNMEMLRRMETIAGLITVHKAGSAADAAPPNWMTSPTLVAASLTPTGKTTAAQIVALAGALHLLTKRTGGFDATLLGSACGLDFDQVSTLFEHGFIEPCTRDGEPAHRANGTYVRITNNGRKYTTEPS